MFSFCGWWLFVVVLFDSGPPWDLSGALGKDGLF